MKQVLISLVLLLFLSNSVAQTAKDSLTYIQGAFGGATFYQNGVQLKPKSLLVITAENPEAYTLMKRAKVNYDWSQVLGVIGGALIGWPLGTALGGGDPNWALAAAGVGVLVISIPLASGFKKNAIKGAEIYNQGLQDGTSQMPVSLEFTVSGNGPGLLFRF